MSLIDVLIPSFRDSLGNIIKTSLVVIMQETCKSQASKRIQIRHKRVVHTDILCMGTKVCLFC